MRKLKRHHHIGLAFLFGGIYLVIAGIAFTPAHGEVAADTAPAIVIVNDAQVIDQGVDLTWLEGQVGSSPISHYVIERSRNDSEYAEIATTEAASRSYIDADGHLGDLYRVIAEDSSSPANRSEPGVAVSAHEAKLGDIHTVIDNSQILPSTPLPNSPADPEADSPSRPVPNTSESNLMAPSSFADKLDIAVIGHHYLQVGPLLQDLSHANLTLLSSLSSLSIPSQTLAKSECLRQESFIEADRHLLSDANEMDGIMALAACHAIEDLVQ